MTLNDGGREEQSSGFVLRCYFCQCKINNATESDNQFDVCADCEKRQESQGDSDE